MITLQSVWGLDHLLPEKPGGRDYIRVQRNPDRGTKTETLTICRDLGPLDWVKLSSETCVGPGWARSEGCSWGCIWSCTSRASWRVCTGASIGGGDGCRITFTMSVGAIAPESGQRTGSPRVSKETLVDTAAGCEGGPQLWLKLQHKCPTGTLQKKHNLGIKNQEMLFRCLKTPNVVNAQTLAYQWVKYQYNLDTAPATNEEELSQKIHTANKNALCGSYILFQIYCC
jgi:hypothetical protein